VLSLHEGIVSRDDKVQVDKIDYPDDVAFIQDALFKAGYAVTPHEAERLWSAYSDSLCAGWLGLPGKYEDIVQAVEPYLEVRNR
jgi:hypothetical protein